MDIFQKQKQKCKRARIYVRVSDTTGREDTLISPEIQIDHCLRYAKAEGIEIVGEPVIDLNLSGKTFAKRQISKMMDEVKRGEYDTIIVWKWSRWGRNLQESMINMALLDEVGGYLIAATEPVDVTTPTGVFARTQFLAMAQLALDQIREGWRDAHRNRLSKGLPHGGGARFGYDYHPEARKPAEKFTPHPQQFPILREMYLMYIGGAGMRTIAETLNARGLKGNRGAWWSDTSVRKTLDQGFGAGRLTYGEHLDTFSDKWERAITLEEWDAYQARRQDTAENLPPRVAGQKNMFRGLVRCAHCGRRCSVYDSTRTVKGRQYTYRMIRCNGRVNQPKCERSNTIHQAVLIEAVCQWLRGFRDGGAQADDLVARKLQAEQATADAADLNKQIEHFESLKRKGRDLVIQEVLTPEEFKEQRAEYDAEIDRLKVARRAAQTEAEVNILPPADVFDAILAAITEGMDPEGLNLGLRQVIRRLVITADAKGTKRVRVVPRWEPALEAVAAS